MLVLATIDPVAGGLLGAALLILAVLGSVPLALVHLAHACFAREASSRRYLKILWIVIGVCTTLSAALLANGGGPDKLLAPYLPVAVFGPFILAATATDSAGRLRTWSGRLVPLVWLGVFAYVALRVFPRT